MAIKLTKNELKTQKDNLKQYQRYLPTLQLKKQQLQGVVMQIEDQLALMDEEYNKMIDGLDNWIAVFYENKFFKVGKRLENLIKPKNVVYIRENIAGVNVPKFKELTFEDIAYNVEDYPLWVDTAVIKIREIARLSAMVKTLRMEKDLLTKELAITSQRVNLFEKVKIPESQKNIKVIEIYLGDQQTSAVVRGKISKKKLAEAKK